MKTNCKILLSSRLRIATSNLEIEKIWALRNTEYKKYYSQFSESNNDPYDEISLVMYSNNKQQQIISTGRIAFDGSLGLPSDKVIKPALDKLRQQGLILAEPSKFAIAREARGILPTYLSTFYKVAQKQRIDSLIFIIRDKNVGLYKKIINAHVLVEDVGYSYGTDYQFSLLECRINKKLPTYFQTQEKH